MAPLLLLWERKSKCCWGLGNANPTCLPLESESGPGVWALASEMPEASGKCACRGEAVPLWVGVEC